MTRKWRIFARSLLVWACLLGLAIANGALREGLLDPVLGAVPGTLISGLALAGVIFAATYVSLPWIGARSVGELLLIGFGWLALTVSFEFSFGLLRGIPLQDLVAAYRFEGGNIWPLILAVTVVSPWLTAKLRGLIE